MSLQATAGTVDHPAHRMVALPAPAVAALAAAVLTVRLLILPATEAHPAEARVATEPEEGQVLLSRYNPVT